MARITHKDLDDIIERWEQIGDEDVDFFIDREVKRLNEIADPDKVRAYKVEVVNPDSGELVDFCTIYNQVTALMMVEDLRGEIYPGYNVTVEVVYV